MELTQEELKRQLHYDPLTGDFTRLVLKQAVKIGDIAGTIRKDGYLSLSINSKPYLVHRLVWLYEYGYLPENAIDHINRIRDDNRIINLREVSMQCNARNRNTQLNNKSGITGVCWHKCSNKWIAEIKVDNKSMHLGIFKSKTDAARARWEAEVKYNFPNCNTISTSYQYLKDKGVI